MTFTSEKNETSPAWTRDGRAFLFLSNREAPTSAATQNQIYLMRPDGGEARRVTDAKDGVTDFVLSKDGKWLIYRAGRADDAAALPPADRRHRMRPSRKQLTKQPGGIDSWTLVTAGRGSTTPARIAWTPTRRRGATRSSPSTSATRRRRPRVCGRSISIRTNRSG